MQHFLLNQQIAESVLQHYAFFQGEVESFKVIPVRLQNQNAKVRVAGVDYVLKCYESARLPKNIALSHELQHKLCAAGFPVAKLELLKNGESLWGEGDYAYSVHQWVNGQHYEFLTPDSAVPELLVDEVATCLAHLHALVVQELPYSGVVTSSRMVQDELGQSTLAKSRHLWRLRLRWSKSALERRALVAWPVMAKLADRIVYDNEDFGEILLAHNDINWQNVVFDASGKLKALIDFDNIRYVPRALEVGYAALVLVGADEAKLSRFVATYTEQSGQKVDINAVRLAMRIRCLRSFGWAFQAILNRRIGDEKVLLTWVTY